MSRPSYPPLWNGIYTVLTPLLISLSHPVPLIPVTHLYILIVYKSKDIHPPFTQHYTLTPNNKPNPESETILSHRLFILIVLYYIYSYCSYHLIVRIW
jgi:hypothetical protein